MSRKKPEKPNKKRAKKLLTPEQLRRRQNRRLALLGVLRRIGFVAVLLIAAVLALTVFFKVNVIRVEGSTHYSDLEISTAMNIHKGDNLYLWNKFSAGEELQQQKPYVVGVRVRRHLPDTVVITVVECPPVLAVPSDGGYYLLSEGGKVLELAEDNSGLPVVTGVSLMGAQPGDSIDPNGDAYTAALLEILQALRDNGMLPRVKFINLQSLTDVRIGYDNRFDIRIGTMEELSYRLRFVTTVIAERLSPSDIGRLYWDSRERLHFVPSTAEEVAASGVTLEEGAAAQDALAEAASGAPDAVHSADGQPEDTPQGDASTEESTDESDDDSTDDSYDESYDESDEER